MLHSLSRACTFAALCGLLWLPTVAWGQGRPRKVHDEAKLFSADAIEQANKVVARIKEKHKKDLYIETVAEAPPKDERAKWAKTRFNDAGVDGIYVVIINGKPLSYRYIVGDHTRENGYFSTEDMKQLDHILKTNLAKSADETLTEVANFTLERMTEHARAKGPAVQPKKANPAVVQRQAPPVVHGNAREDGMPDWVGWVCLIGGILLVVWVVFALIRAMTGMMGGGGYGGGYGGGGGGFFTGMLGGLFGSMAGMWMYNNFFGGHANYSSGDWGGGQQGSSGADGSGAAPYEPDTDAGGGGGGDADGGGGDAGGGDWGGKGGGEDAGGGDAGGGDWGGGGDVGGGGGDAGGAGCGGGGCGGGGGD